MRDQHSAGRNERRIKNMQVHSERMHLRFLQTVLLGSVALHGLDGVDIVGGCLIDKIVEPVLIQKVCVAAPGNKGRLGAVYLLFCLQYHPKSAIFLCASV